MGDTVRFMIAKRLAIPEIPMPPSATISDLKKEIEKRIGVAKDRQTLRYDDKVLIDENTIGYYNFGQSASLLFIEKFNVSVKFGTEKNTIRVDETSSGSDVKTKIKKCWGIPIENMTLYHNSIEMEDGQIISEYKVNGLSEIEVKLN